MMSDCFVSCMFGLLRRLARTGAAAALLVAPALVAGPAAAQSFAPSMCQAVAQALPGALFASLVPDRPARPLPILRAATETDRSVIIRFVGHSTFRLETPGGVIIATDYAGNAGSGPVPTVVTMNHAHSSHFTHSPDPRVEHVLRGWNPDGGRADHHLVVGDVLIRNVTTDIRTWDGGLELDGNSIFIFEVADLCIGHLGHLHQVLEDDHIALIGRLDVVMVPVDGVHTMSQQAISDVVRRLRASIILPMHYFSAQRLGQFLAGVRTDFPVLMQSEPQLVVSLATLPREPTVVVLPGY